MYFLETTPLLCEGSNLVLDAGCAKYIPMERQFDTTNLLSLIYPRLGIFDFSVSVTNQFGCSSIDEITIEVESCRSITDIEGNEPVFYPNPFKDVLVHSNVNMRRVREIEVYDALGRRMKILNKTNFSLEFQHTSGLYFIKIGETVKVISCYFELICLKIHNKKSRPKKSRILSTLYISTYILPNSPFTVAEINPPSAFPFSLPITAPITFPISEGPLAPSVEIVSWTVLITSSSLI